MFCYGDDYLGALLTDGPLAARCEYLRALRSDDFGPRVQAELRGDDAMVIVRGIAIADAAWRRASRRLGALAAVEHPYVAGLVAYGRHEGLAYLVHEHDDGPRLNHVLRERRGKLSLPVLLPVFSQVVQAVSEAHRKGVVVGAVRPQDLRVVKAKDDDLEIRIRNFGLDVVLGVPAGRSKSTDHPSIYRAPESDVGMSPSSDVFSLGVLFIRLLTGPLPRSEGPEERAEMLRIRLSDAVDAGRLSEGLAMRIAEAVELDASMRPHDATVLLERLLEAVPAAQLRLAVDAEAAAPPVTDESSAHWPARQWTVLDAWERPRHTRRAPVQASTVLTESGTSIELPVRPVPVVSGATVRVAPVPPRRKGARRLLRRVALGMGLLSTGSAVAVAATVREAPPTEARASELPEATPEPASPSSSELESSTLLVEAAAVGVLTVDGRVVGRTNEPVEIDAGVHVVRVEAEGHRSWRARLDVAPGQERRLVVVLEREPTLVAPTALAVGHRPGHG
ncbi:MAG: PEGA domain-containing protein [Myxococcales bacterium]|nr:PEGA domain-containing protein [Myxococcales bacterium]